MNSEIESVVQNLISREGHTIKALASTMTSAQARLAITHGRFKKVSYVHDLYQDAETGDFWAALEDGRMVRKFSEVNGQAEFREDGN